MLQKIILGGEAKKSAPNSPKRADSAESDLDELGKGGSYEERLMRRKNR